MNKIYTLILVSIMFSCNSSTSKHLEKKVTYKTSRQNKEVVPKQKELNQIENLETENNENDSNCIRGKAEPIIKKSVFPNTTFQIQPDKLTAIETVNFDNGDKLIIKNWGCEYYVLTFRFETSRYQEDTANLSFWFKKSALLLNELTKGIDSPINIKSGIDKLVTKIDDDKKNNYQNLALGEEIDFGGDDIRDFLTIEKIEKLTDRKFAIEISFSTGPL